jgi:hypothetical protein
MLRFDDAPRCWAPNERDLCQAPKLHEGLQQLERRKSALRSGAGIIRPVDCALSGVKATKEGIVWERPPGTLRSPARASLVLLATDLLTRALIAVQRRVAFSD